MTGICSLMQRWEIFSVHAVSLMMRSSSSLIRSSYAKFRLFTIKDNQIVRPHMQQSQTEQRVNESKDETKSMISLRTHRGLGKQGWILIYWRSNNLFYHLASNIFRRLHFSITCQEKGQKEGYDIAKGKLLELELGLAVLKSFSKLFSTAAMWHHNSISYL